MLSSPGEPLFKTQVRRRSSFLTPKTLSIVSTLILPSETLRIYALFSIILYIIHIVNHRFCLLTNKHYSLRKVQPKATPLRCRCMELPLFS